MDQSGEQDPVSAIEAALQAGLGGGAARPDLARKALAGAGSEQLEAWLEAVARELGANASALVPEEMVEAIAEKMLADRGQSLRAHRLIQGRAVGALVKRG